MNKFKLGGATSAPATTTNRAAAKMNSINDVDNGYGYAAGQDELHLNETPLISISQNNVGRRFDD